VAFNGITHDSYNVMYPRRDDCLSHDTYALEDAVPTDAETFRDLLADAHERLGDGAILEFEREIATFATCAACGHREALFRPLHGLTVGAAVCPVCGDERAVELVHSAGAADAELLARTPAELGLPRFDVVTARSGEVRVHYLLGGALDSLAELATA
jgi:hypothetical protein